MYSIHSSVPFIGQEILDHLPKLDRMEILFYREITLS